MWHQGICQVPISLNLHWTYHHKFFKVTLYRYTFHMKGSEPEWANQPRRHCGEPLSSNNKAASSSCQQRMTSSSGLQYHVTKATTWVGGHLWLSYRAGTRTMPIFPSMPEDESDKLLKRELCYSISGNEVTDTVTGFSNACLLSEHISCCQCTSVHSAQWSIWELLRNAE